MTPLFHLNKKFRLSGDVMKFCILFLTFISTASYAEKYFCVANKTTGFVYDKSQKEWVINTFNNINDTKYIISAHDVKGYKLKVTRLGTNYPDAICKDFLEHGYLYCEGVGGSFKFNKNSGRYLKSHAKGYIHVIPGVEQIKTDGFTQDMSDEGSPSPFIEIGTCSLI